MTCSKLKPGKGNKKGFIMIRGNDRRQVQRNEKNLEIQKRKKKSMITAQSENSLEDKNERKKNPKVRSK